MNVATIAPLPAAALMRADAMRVLVLLRPTMATLAPSAARREPRSLVQLAASSVHHRADEPAHGRRGDLLIEQGHASLSRAACTTMWPSPLYITHILISRFLTVRRRTLILGVCRRRGLATTAASAGGSLMLSGRKRRQRVWW